MPHSDPLLPPPPSMPMPVLPLTGLRVGLVCGDSEAELAAQFKAAAQGLGAQVTLLDPARMLGEGTGLDPVARMLGRLYGAVACHGLPSTLTQRLARAAAVPVVEVETVLALLRGHEGGAERRRRAAQAAVLAALR
jgi:hypothetical protein